MKNVMLDLETMGTSPDAAIIAVGASVFDPATGALGEAFYRVVNLKSAMQAGGVANASTIIWWMQQSDEARSEICGEGYAVEDVLWAFRAWLGHISDDPHVWGNGADFDNVILRSAYSRSDIPVPWPYKNNRCFRTMRAHYPPVNTSTWGVVKHNALSDAVWQARYLCEILGGKK